MHMRAWSAASFERGRTLAARGRLETLRFDVLQAHLTHQRAQVHFVPDQYRPACSVRVCTTIRHVVWMSGCTECVLHIFLPRSQPSTRLQKARERVLHACASVLRKYKVYFGGDRQTAGTPTPRTAPPRPARPPHTKFTCTSTRPTTKSPWIGL